MHNMAYYFNYFRSFRVVYLLPLPTKFLPYFQSSGVSTSSCTLGPQYTPWARVPQLSPFPVAFPPCTPSSGLLPADDPHEAGI